MKKWQLIEVFLCVPVLVSCGQNVRAHKELSVCIGDTKENDFFDQTNKFVSQLGYQSWYDTAVSSESGATTVMKATKSDATIWVTNATKGPALNDPVGFPVSRHNAFNVSFDGRGEQGAESVNSSYVSLKSAFVTSGYRVYNDASQCPT